MRVVNIPLLLIYPCKATLSLDECVVGLYIIPESSMIVLLMPTRRSSIIVVCWQASLELFPENQAPGIVNKSEFP